MAVSRRSIHFRLPRSIMGVVIALVLALGMNFYLTNIAPNGRITDLAKNSFSPFLLVFCFSLMIICIGALQADVFAVLLGKKRKFTPEQLRMMGMVAVSAIIFVFLVTVQKCRQPIIQITLTQLNKVSVVMPGDIYPASTGSPLTAQVVNLASPQTPLDNCQWMTSTDNVKLTPPDSCMTVVTTTQSGPGMMLLTLVAKPPYCSSQNMAPVTIIWQ